MIIYSYTGLHSHLLTAHLPPSQEAVPAAEMLPAGALSVRRWKEEGEEVVVVVVVVGGGVNWGVGSVCGTVGRWSDSVS